MKIAISEAKGLLAELVRRAEAGEDVILTRHGQDTARIVAARPVPDAKTRDKILRELQAEAAAKATPGPSAEHGTDFLYDEFGLPK